MRLVALVDDLMDRSRLSGALPATEFVRNPASCAGADVVVIDLGRHAVDVTAARAAAPHARILAFGPHVDESAFAQARTDGADTTIPRSAFFRDPAAAVNDS